MRYLLLSACMLFTAATQAQTTTDTAAKSVEKPYSFVQQMPAAKYDYHAYIKANLRYPDDARENMVSGRVIVQFVVKKDGTIAGAKILRGLGHGCDEEALRVILSMPPWAPGKQEGKPVNVLFTIPVTFSL